MWRIIRSSCQVTGASYWHLYAHNNVVERFRLCFYAKTDANALKLRPKLELVSKSDNVTVCT